MLPTYPNRPARKEALLRANMPPRKIYHNCAGKHLALMLLARELGENVPDYWKRDSKTQTIVKEMVAYMSGVSEDEISIGVDGCGVPVFAVPFWRIGQAYLKLACPELIDDPAIRQAVEANMARLHAFPNMIAGANVVDTIITAKEGMIAKSGAMGVYAIGCRDKRLGIVFKTADGSHDEFAASAIEAFIQLGIDPELIEEIKKFYPDTIVNDNKFIVGNRKAVFKLV
jgi:L-asparaginase II